MITRYNFCVNTGELEQYECVHGGYVEASEAEAIVAERDSALAQNAELVAMVDRLNNFSNERIAMAATLRNCIEKVLGCEELVFNSDVVLVVSSELVDDIRCALDATPTQHLRDRDAEVGRAGFVEGVRQMAENEIGWFGHDVDSCANQYAEKVRSGRGGV